MHTSYNSDEVGFKVFRGTLRSWNSLFEDAAAYASRIGRERIISISHSAAGAEGVVTVWFYLNTPKNNEQAEGW